MPQSTRTTTSDGRAENDAIAAALEEMAELLSVQGAGTFRIRAYRHAAATVRECPAPMRAIDQVEGLEGLERLPGIGPSIA